MEAVGTAAAVPLRIAWGVLKKHMAARMENEVGFEQLRESLLGELESIKEDLHELRCRELKTALDHLESAYLIQQYYDPKEDGDVDVDGEQAVDRSAHARSVTAAGERAKWFFEETLRNARAAFGTVPEIDGKVLATKASIVAAYHVHCGEPDVAKRLCIKFLRDLFALPETVRLFDDFRDEHQSGGGGGSRTTVILKHLVPGQRQKVQSATRAIAAIADYVLSVAPHSLNDEMCRSLAMGSGGRAAHHDPWYVAARQRSVVLRKRGAARVLGAAMLRTRVLTTALGEKSVRVSGVNILTGESAAIGKIRAVPRDPFTALATCSASSSAAASGGGGGGDSLITLYAGHQSGHISMWTVDESQVRRGDVTYEPAAWAHVAAHAHPVALLALHAARQRLFSAAASEAVISCWDASVPDDDNDDDSAKLRRRRRHLFSLDGHEAAVSGLAVDATRLFSCDLSGVLKVWLIGAELSTCVQTVAAHTSAGVALRACNGFLYTACETEICVWTASDDDEAPVTRLCSLDDDAHISALAVNAEKMFVGLESGRIACWDLRFAPPRRSQSMLCGHAAPVTGLMLFRAMLVSSSEDGSVRCWWLAG